MKNELNFLTQTMTMNLEIKNLHLLGAIENLRSKEFKYHNIKNKSGTFKYISGLSVHQFDFFTECIKPYIYLIPYPVITPHYLLSYSSCDQSSLQSESDKSENHNWNKQYI